jgi:hypothetical protein
VLRLTACAASAMVGVVWKAAVDPFAAYVLAGLRAPSMNASWCYVVQQDDVGKAGIDC